MRHLNYNHLQYFWAVGREGSVVKAAEILHLTPQTISGQLKLLEESVGQPLFDRVGRRLVLSEMGNVVMEYAEEIFAIGAELSQVVRGQKSAGHSVLSVGVVSSMPKLIAERIIAPSLIDDEPLRIRCHEASLEQLLGELAVHRLDLVLSDQPMPQGLSLRAFNHRLGESGLAFFCQRSKARHYRAKFPDSLDEAPMLLPSQHSALRRRMEEWFDSINIAPQVVGEFDDSALLKAFGEAGAGLFAAPTVIENEICKMYSMSVIGRTDSVSEQFYAISPERRIKHPSVARITDTARTGLFSRRQIE
ncbi:MAG: transcriptional activator NhaR [Woeseiaceae bacterium]|nr:transcriptional activator NhaR [Woeseiaceae bacterium]